MQLLTITAAEFSFVGLPDEIADTVKDSSYAVDFTESYNSTVRDIIIRPKIEIPNPDIDHRIIVELSGEFNTVSFFVEPASSDYDDEERIEIFTSGINDLIPESDMNEAVEILELEESAKQSGNAAAIAAADMVRSATHTQITKSLTDKVNEAIPVLLQDHSNEERCLAGVIRAMKFIQKNSMP